MAAQYRMEPPASSGASAVGRAALSGLAAVGRFRIYLLVGLSAVFSLLLIFAAVSPRTPRPSGSAVSWGLLAAGVAVGAGGALLCRALLSSPRVEVLMGATGLARWA